MQFIIIKKNLFVLFQRKTYRGNMRINMDRYKKKRNNEMHKVSKNKNLDRVLVNILTDFTLFTGLFAC